MFACSKCDESGKLTWTSRDGGVCYRCKGSGKTKTQRNPAKLEAKKAEVLEAMLVRAEAKIAADPALRAKLEAPCWCNCGLSRYAHITGVAQGRNRLWPAFAADILNGKE